LRTLTDYPEAIVDFIAFVPGQRRQQTWLSTVAYVVR
jgi:ribonucleoside-diphosphate reductase alpha chain